MNDQATTKQELESSEEERSEFDQVDAAPYDAIVIGAGLCGIIFLAYARDRGLNCVTLEKQGGVGGL
jgi:NADPH-dependent 2,4-dienoyl-CoA reductase/sulfur reductase-like enzyme